jgi:2'-5' RNA ligase
MRSMALKINVSKNDQDALNDLLQKSGYTPQKRKFHCTLGFIDSMIPEEEITAFGDAIVREMQQEVTRIKPLYEVDAAQFLFKHVIALVPTPATAHTLNEMHCWLAEKVTDLSEGRWEVEEKFVPHMTLWRAHHLDGRFKKLELLVEKHPSYHLTEAAFVPL